MKDFGQPHVIILSVLVIEIIFHILFNGKLKREEAKFREEISKLTEQLKEAERK